MHDFRKLAVMILAPIAASWALPAQAQTEFSGAGENSEIDCNGGTVQVEGASNTLTIRGACTGLNLTGAGNRIVIDLATKSTIQVEGADNQIRWRAPGEARPRISMTGAGNRIMREK
ncbi:hypothetical protein HNP52_000499 [Sphingomonas kyeonggiensis]|uniref:DUF3060 domain-containing protein n=1 Tax=Sphingomonas kyeonggiensis TaxID=1268553 RepID=A0A7W7JYK4_9SPHN|nr:DUF3060 domain-containing protein [Sphingomonas kyeonggiensis]MBB4837448.1 hypothetical protein [Sphingomonas kyeonggiensis]